MKKLLLLVFILSTTFSFSQSKDLEKAQTFLNKKGEITFTFKVDNLNELNDFTRRLSIVNFDEESKTVKAWANENQFKNFLNRNIPFKVSTSDNTVKSEEIRMTSSPNSRTSNLTFPLTAYPTYADYALQMANFAADNPSICQLVDIGGTAEGVSGGDKRLLFIKLSDNIGVSEAEPKLMYTSSMHGDEIAGFPMMLNLIDYFITAYKDVSHVDHSRIKNLIDNSEIWINPMANPDGTYYGSSSNTSVANARRANANGWDLNRNYPDNVGGPHPDGNPNYEIETQHFMNLASNNHFVLSANFHGGTEVVNYPWDNTYTRHPDDDLFFLISKEYAVNCQDNSPSGYMDATYTNYVWPGVTNGADWYRVEGGRQDYMNFYQQSKEVTIELSNTKLPAASQLVNFWNYNKEALIDYLVQGTYGFTGVVKDAVTGNLIEATVKIDNHDALGSWTKTTLPHGNYYRPIKSGTYDIVFEAPCYQSFTLSNQTITDYQTITLPEVQLMPIAATAPSGLTASNVQANTTTLSWDVINGATYDYRYRPVGSPTWITTNTSNTSVNLTGLNIGTKYEAQVRSICNSTSPFSNSINFTTTNTVTISASYFETGWDGWSDGGSDCARYSGSNSYEGNYSIRLRDNSGTSSSMTSPSFDLSSFGDVEISFYYYASSMENNEDFWLRYYNGSSWTTIETYVSGTDFNNGSFYSGTFTLNEAEYILASNAQFRFQSDASNNSDYIYIDQVIITGIPSGPVDIIPPVITLMGDSTINLEEGNPYNEEGATATDDIDGDISANIVIGGDMVDTNTVGSYIITYNVSDVAGNEATEVTRIVNVTQDATAPIITLTGDSLINLEQGDLYNEQGATATDNIDGDISANIVIGGDMVDTNTVGTYIVTYNVIDVTGNAAAEATRTVNITQDVTAPVITLNGASLINLNLGNVYTEQGAIATDNVDGDLTSSIAIGGDVVDGNIAGTYIVKYNVSDSAGNAATEVSRTVIVAPDTEAPVITLIGASIINLNLGNLYTEQGAIATDNVDGDLTSSIAIGGDAVDGNTAGVYIVTYNVSDAAGNAATEVIRTVNVIPDTTAPVITLLGSSTVDLNVGGTYIEQGATAVDNIDGDLTSSILIGGDTVDSNTAGTYMVTYNVSDAAGNVATEVIRMVIVADVPDTVVLHEGFFEVGWDGWSDGGSDCDRVSDSRSYEGNYSIRLRDNSGSSSSMTSPLFDLSSYNSVEFSFYFYANSMENGEDFWLQYNDGSGFTTIATWTRGVDFNNGNFENRLVTLDASNYNFVSNSQFRIICDASGNNDQIYIDQVVITANGGSNNARIVTKNLTNKKKKDFRLYPNPVNNILNIKTQKGGVMSYRIINMLGQIVETGQTENKVIVDNLEAGMYYIEVKNGSDKMMKRFIKK
ncbi:DUF5011 domain-containing protein [Flavobacteriaceae bacterium S0862]|nr:DUF5011 domain-containing protein [Flavobacteriaceae bacterium S0862]